MDNQFWTIYNNYIRYLDNLNYGKSNQDYTILYNLVLYKKFELDKESILQYLTSNLV